MPRAVLQPVSGSNPPLTQIGYENMTGQEVLRQLLPAEVEVPTSFETIGHVLHLNLKEQVPPCLLPPSCSSVPFCNV